MRILHILALLSLFLYCAPVRACVLQEWTVGTSCHADGDENDSAPIPEAAGGDHGCVPHEAADHDEGCVCEQPKVSADRSQINHGAVDFIASPAVLILHLVPANVGGSILDATVLPEFDPPGRTFPLLN